MKKLYIIFAVVLFSTCAFAQQLSLTEGHFANTHFSISNDRQVDTIWGPVFNLVPPRTCADTPAYYKLSTGFLTGNGTLSGYPMTECSQGLANSSAGSVTNAFALVQYVAGNVGTFSAKVYAVDAAFKPTTLLGTSTPVDINLISPGVPTVFSFSPAVSVTSNFAISIVYPTGAGDTIFVGQTKAGCMDPTKDGYAYLNLASTQWMQYKTIMQQNAMQSFDLFVGALVNRTTNIQSNSISNSISIYPNPSNDVVRVISINKIGKINMVDCLGQIVYTEKTNSYTSTINVSNLPEGIYFAQIETEKGFTTEKIIIKK